MTISDILQHPVLPFEIEDVKLVKLFSFFLHSAPTIESATAISMEAARLDQNWMSFITSYPKESWLVIAPNCTFGAYMIKAGLDGNAVVSRRKKGFVYKRKSKDETDCEACLRHIRNAIDSRRKDPDSRSRPGIPVPLRSSDMKYIRQMDNRKTVAFLLFFHTRIPGCVR